MSNIADFQYQLSVDIYSQILNLTLKQWLTPSSAEGIAELNCFTQEE